ncbi:MAG: alpha/beta hydrolase [Polynucleobacter sp.]|nr:MAG: alpha/beta hydrolase [Polynucleobacter sp.]
MSRTIKLHFQGPAGLIEASLDLPEGIKHHPASFRPRGIALVAHPHPLLGGTMDNKVAQTLARTFAQLGYVTLRPNFRGVGASEGVHDDGKGEAQDLIAVIAWMRDPFNWQGIPELEGQAWPSLVAELPLAMAGFSFGSYVSSYVVKHLEEQGAPPERLIMVGSATSKWEVAPVPKDTIVIHGEVDDVIPLTSVLDWARPQELTVQVIPGADHFFHRKLHCIRDLILRAWHGQPDPSQGA